METPHALHAILLLVLQVDHGGSPVTWALYCILFFRNFDILALEDPSHEFQKFENKQ